MKGHKMVGVVVDETRRYSCMVEPDDTVSLAGSHDTIGLIMREAGTEKRTVVILSYEDAIDMATRIMARVMHGKSVVED